MSIFPYKLVKVADGLRVWVPNHFCYTDFGVRGSKLQNRYGRRYVCTDTPGTGFIERESESHSYNDFVRRNIYSQRRRYGRMLLGREPNYRKEIKRTRAALDQAHEPMKRRILDSYLNALGVGEIEERIERIEQAIKNRVKQHHHNKFYVSVLSHYKHKVQQLEEDMRSVELDVKDTCSAEQYDAWLRLVEAFMKVASCRRIWHQNDHSRHQYEQVFFDLGIFDFIRSESFLPILRTSVGTTYYILPTCLIAARNSVDFDVLPLKGLAIVCQEMAVQETIELISSRLGDAASVLRVPTLDQTWYFNHVRPIMHFVGAYDELRALQDNES